MSEEDLKAEIEKLRAENDQLKNKSVRGLSLKVSEKGAVSLYGVGRFPVTLYKEQWTKNTWHEGRNRSLHPQQRPLAENQGLIQGAVEFDCLGNTSSRPTGRSHR